MTTSFITIGVLALQGAFREHVEYFNKVIQQLKYDQDSFTIIEVRNKEELLKCNALVIPGGESTTISLIAKRSGMLPSLIKFINNPHNAVWGTCAGLIFLLSNLRNGQLNQEILGGLDIESTRNAFGRQLSSFLQVLDFSKFIPEVVDFPTVFIRAPVISKVLTKADLKVEAESGILVSPNSGSNPAHIEVLYTLEEKNLIVAVRQGRTLGTSFHPELADDIRFHEWFVDEFVLQR